jgi:hypothetical protein
MNLENKNMNDYIKSDWNLRECFKQLRKNNLGSGEIILTIEQQEEICDLVERFYLKQEYYTLANYSILLSMILNDK